MIKIYISDLEKNPVADLSIDKDKVIELNGNIPGIEKEDLDKLTVLRDEIKEDSVLTFDDPVPVSETLKFVQALSYNLEDGYIVNKVDGLDKEIDEERDRLQEMFNSSLEQNLSEEESVEDFKEEFIKEILNDLVSGEITLEEIEEKDKAFYDYLVNIIGLTEENIQEQAQELLQVMFPEELSENNEEEDVIFYKN